MKVTVEIANTLLEEAEAYAESSGKSLSQLIEEGLRNVVPTGRPKDQTFHLKDGSVGGSGVALDLSWEEVRQMIYEGRGE